jgi:peptidoglycan/xylan/chitin deacetylase (PgdA/CDA1 family)
MPVRQRRTGRARTAVLAAVLVAGIGAAAFALQRGAPESAAAEPERTSSGTSVLEEASVLAPARLPERVRVVLVRDRASDAFAADVRDRDALFAGWTRALEGIGAEATELAIDTGAGAKAPTLPGDTKLVVVPSSPCLGAATRALLTRALEEGRGVLVTWLTGLRDGGCGGESWRTLAALTGAGRVDTIETRPEVYVVLPSGGPLALDMPPGARLELRPASQVALRAGGRDAYYGDFGLNPEPAAGVPLLDAAVTRAQHGDGRLVYWGFDLPHVADRPWSASIARLLLRNSVAWAAGVPMADASPWPRGREAAVVLAQDVEHDFANARHAVDSLRAAKVTGTFFLVTDLAAEHRELVAAMDAVGEIGTHTDDHTLLGGTARARQATRLAATQASLRELTGSAGKGLRPPEEQFDDATLEEWQRAGGSYLFGSTNARSAGPEIVDTEAGRMVLLGRTADDDFATVRKAAIEEPARLARLYLEAYDKTRALGGLYLLSYHSNLLARPELVPALATVARRVAADEGAWLTTAEEVAEWWTARAALRLTVRREAGALVLEARNAGGTAVRGAVARVTTPRDGAVRSAEGGTLRGVHDGVARVALPDVPAGGTVTVWLHLVEGA